MIRLKNEKQIDGIRKSCKLLAKMFDEILPKIHARMTTKEIDDMALQFMTLHGGKPAWYRENFPGAVCISINDEVIHGIPSKHRKLREGDLVSIDAGIDLDGYISDATRSIAIGKVSDDVAQLMRVTKEALKAGIAACKVGNRIHDIAKAVTKVCEPYGYGIVYQFCGHGVGLEVHEEPSVPNVVDGGANPRIQAGMVLAIEPMINMGKAEVEVLDDDWTIVSADGSISCHEENTVAVFRDHTEILTQL